jgi:hypothetical protein
MVELTCMMCARAVGSITLRRPTAKILIPRNLRCEVCTGRPVVNDMFRVTAYPTLAPVKLQAGTPRHQIWGTDNSGASS